MLPTWSFEEALEPSKARARADSLRSQVLCRPWGGGAGRPRSLAVLVQSAAPTWKHAAQL